MPELWIPRHLKPAVKRTRVVFYYQPKLDRVLVGFPENFPAPAGFQKIVCETAAEVDRWSEKMRKQERRDEEMTDEQREAIEGPIRDAVRKEMVYRRDHARNQLNRDFCQFAIDRIDERARRRKMVKESYMHIEGHEDGK